MATQTEMNFETSSPINESKLSGQNKRLYFYLKAGNKIHCMHPDISILRIGYLNSRISDLKNKFNVPIESKFVEVEFYGQKTSVKEYKIIKP